MRETLAFWFRRIMHLSGQWCREQFRHVTHCRACDRRVSPLTTICAYCGAGTPVRIPPFPVVLITGIACEVFLLAIHCPLIAPFDVFQNLKTLIRGKSLHQVVNLGKWEIIFWRR